VKELSFEKQYKRPEQKGRHDIWHDVIQHNGLNATARFEKCKQLFEYQHLLLLRDIWWSKL
jgi:hypothetical protein